MYCGRIGLGTGDGDCIASCAAQEDSSSPQMIVADRKELSRHTAVEDLAKIARTSGLLRIVIEGGRQLTTTACELLVQVAKLCRGRPIP